MGRIKAVVIDGRLVVDAPTALPDGLEVELVIDDGGDDLDEKSRAALHNALVASNDALNEGKGRSGADVLASIPG